MTIDGLVEMSGVDEKGKQVTVPLLSISSISRFYFVSPSGHIFERVEVKNIGDSSKTHYSYKVVDQIKPKPTDGKSVDPNSPFCQMNYDLIERRINELETYVSAQRQTTTVITDNNGQPVLPPLPSSYTNYTNKNKTLRKL
ncbi:hypothetical protein HY636_04200 [Candidatus Woesearchaeota archaeon]|nr:hypothetical protein [Candidatus Woesearchaeota archaeon]